MSKDDIPNRTVALPKSEGIKRGNLLFGSYVVLSRLQAFLPEIRKANQQLLSHPQPTSFQIDADDDDGDREDSRIISMNLGLGVFTAQAGHDPLMKAIIEEKRGDCITREDPIESFLKDCCQQTDNSADCEDNADNADSALDSNDTDDIDATDDSEDSNDSVQKRPWLLEATTD